MVLCLIILYLFSSFNSFVNRVCASWQQPSCTSSSSHHSAGSSQRPGSPTWQWRERFGPDSFASAFCAWDGVRTPRVSSNERSLRCHRCNLELPFSHYLLARCRSRRVYVFSFYCFHHRCGEAGSPFCRALCCDAFVLQSSWINKAASSSVGGLGQTGAALLLQVAMTLCLMEKMSTWRLQYTAAEYSLSKALTRGAEKYGKITRLTFY